MQGEAFGCPYKTFSPAELAESLRALQLPNQAVQEALGKARAGHFQLACTAAWEGVHKCMCDTGINHPNQVCAVPAACLRHFAFHEDSTRRLSGLCRSEKHPSAHVMAVLKSAC